MTLPTIALALMVAGLALLALSLDRRQRATARYVAHLETCLRHNATVTAALFAALQSAGIIKVVPMLPPAALRPDEWPCVDEHGPRVLPVDEPR